MIDRRKFLKRAVLFIPAVGLFRRLANDAQAKTAVAGMTRRITSMEWGSYRQMYRVRQVR